jgi:hypothetical protein
MLLAANLEGHQRRRKAGPDIDLLVSGANQIGGADRRQEHQRECARFKPGKSAIPVLLWPDQLQVVSSVETNGSRSHGRAYCNETPRSRSPATIRSPTNRPDIQTIGQSVGPAQWPPTEMAALTAAAAMAAVTVEPE